MKTSAWRYLWKAEDIRRKLLITLMILVIYRLAAHVPIPGANREAISAIITGGGAGSTFVGILDMLSGGTVSNFSVLAMGVYPYITSQIILQLLVPIIPALQRKMEEDPQEGRKWMERWTYILAVPMAALQAIGQIRIFSSLAGGVQIIDNFGISEYGIRNQGLSLLIFAGIVSRLPQNFGQIISNQENRWITLAIMVVITALIIYAIVFVQQGQRNIPVMYPGRRVGNRQSMPVKGTLPLKVNMAGMIPLIFGQSLLTFPAIVASFFVESQTFWVSNLATNVQALFGGTSSWYWLLYWLMVVGFTFFYTDVLFAQQDYGTNLKRAGAQIPGVSRGAPTQRYLTKVLRRITFPGAFFLGTIAIFPFIVGIVLSGLGLSGLTSGGTGTMLITSSGLLIVVGVVRDTFQNIDAELKLHGYDEKLLVR